MKATVNVAATIPADHEAALIAEAKAAKSSVSAIIRELVKRHLEGQK